MKPSIVQLFDFALRQLAFDHRIDGDPPNVTDKHNRNLGVEVAARTKNNNDELTELRILLRIRINTADPQTGNVELKADAEATVRVMHSTPGKTVEQRTELALLNGVALMFGTLREVVFQVSARSDAGAIQLPAMNFVGLLCTLDAKRYTLGNTSVAAGNTAKNQKSPAELARPIDAAPTGAVASSGSARSKRAVTKRTGR